MTTIDTLTFPKSEFLGVVSGSGDKHKGATRTSRSPSSVLRASYYGTWGHWSGTAVSGWFSQVVSHENLPRTRTEYSGDIGTGTNTFNQVHQDRVLRRPRRKTLVTTIRVKDGRP